MCYTTKILAKTIAPYMSLTDKTPWWHILSCSRCHNAANTSAETRAKILDAAFAEIHRVGFQAASVQNILRKTGLTKGALYHHFPNKKALGLAVIDEIISQSVNEIWISKLEHTVDPVTTLQQIIIDTGRAFTQEDIELGCPLSNLSQEMSAIDPEFRTRLEKIYTKWRTTLENALERGKQNGSICKYIDTRQFAIVFIAALEGCIALAKNTQDMSVLMDCGSGLINLITTLRPSHPTSADEHTGAHSV